MAENWISNTIPSLPAPPTKPIIADLGGFCFTSGGIAHPVNTNLAEEAVVTAPGVDVSAAIQTITGDST